jgi:hypothetical protein
LLNAKASVTDGVHHPSEDFNEEEQQMVNYLKNQEDK